MATREKTTARQRSTAIAKRAQPHGGALNVGGTPGNRGGYKLPEVLRARSRDVYEKWLGWAEKQVDDPATPPELMMQIGNTAAKYGLGDSNKIDADEVKDRIKKMLDDVSNGLSPEESSRVIALIRPAWDAA